MHYEESDSVSYESRPPATHRPCSEKAHLYNECEELLYYKTSGTKYLHIFNHKEYKRTQYFRHRTPSPRNGTEKDVSRLTGLFENLGYKTRVHNNLTYDEIMDLIRKISDDEHADTACLCFAVLTHGGGGGVLYAADRPYQLQELTAPLAHGHPGLVGKPKIFFVQACRGDQHDHGRRLELDGSAAVTIASHADFLILNSSVEEHVSYRTVDGSFLIQELCDVVERYHGSLDLLRITTLVQNRVCYDRIARTSVPPTKEEGNKRQIYDAKQMPETRHTLTKIFMF